VNTCQRFIHANKKFLGRLILVGLVLVNIIFFPRIAQADARDPIFNARTNGAPAYLQMLDNVHELYSEYGLPTLAGHLINYGVVSTDGCMVDGLKGNGQGSDCGVARSMPVALVWQNRFNDEILKASQKTGVPPLLIKNIFVWESQFWPQTVFVHTSEYGLGHMTQMGADSLLRWNYPFYQSFCNANLPSDRCQQVYVEQPDYVQAMLRGLVIQQVNDDCSDCSFSLDLTRANKSVIIFANTLVANANLVKHYIKFFTGSDAASVASYPDLWAFTLASYNAGPGCFKNALAQTVYSDLALTWKNLSTKLEPACKGSIDYVKFISNVASYRPQDDPGTASTPMPTVIIKTPDATQTLPAETATPTASVQTPTSEVTQPAIVETPTPSAQTSTPDVTQTAVIDSPTPTISQPDTSATPTSTDEFTPTASAMSVSAAATTSPTPQATTSAAIINMLKPLHVGNELVIKIDPNQRQAVLQTLAGLNISVAPHSEQMRALNNTIIIQVNPQNMTDVLAKLRNSAGVEFVEPNYLVLASSVNADASQPNDPLFPSQSNLTRVQVPQVWNAVATATLQPVIVAVLDTGVNVSHPDLVNSIWQNRTEATGAPGVDDDSNGYIDDLHGWNFVDNNNNPDDDNGHGTHLAGIIAGATNNSIGIAGIASNARILPIKVLDRNGYGSYANVAQGIIYATDMGARIIELGFGGTGSSELMQNAISYALAHNVLIVAAAGNGGNSVPYYPGAYDGVIAVSALDSNNNLASFSSSGKDISLSAPGTGIVSTGLSDTYPTMSGTSMSSAEVSGIAALLAGEPQYSSTDALRSALLGSALDLGNPGRDPQYGYGMIQALNALNYAGTLIPTDTPAPSPTPSGTKTPAPGGGVHTAAITTEHLYGISQLCSYSIVNPGNSIDAKMDGNVATCAGAYSASSVGNWTYTSLQNISSIQVVQSGANAVTLEAGFTTSGISSTDTVGLEVSDDAGSTWYQIATYSADQTSITALSYDVSPYFTTVAQVNNAQVRFVGIAGSGNIITINLDEVRLDVNGYVPPTVSITAPTATSFAYGALITFTATANDPQDGDISSSIVWDSNLTGPIGTGSSINTSILLSGTHTIYAQATDSGGAKASVSINITVGDPTNSIHGRFSGNTDLCATCHRTHSAPGSTYLTTNPNSVTTSDAFCLSCHSDVSTHSNKNYNPLYPPEQPAFEVRCIQCHNPHGSSNLFDVQTNIITSLSPIATSGPVNFTALTGTNSFDDGASASHLCTACHASVPNYPDSYLHLSGMTYAGQSCIACHPHNIDSISATEDGFMPIRNTNP
jgi:thermitase